MPDPSSPAPSTLRRAIGLRTVVSTSTGLAFAALEYLVMAGIVGYAAGNLAWLSVAVAGGLALLAWGFYGELNGLYPTAAAVRRYMSRSMDDRVALVITFTYLTTIILVIAADAFIVGSAIAHVLGEPSWLVAFYIGLLLSAATLVNLRGLAVAGAVQDVATFTVVVTTGVIGAIALAHHQSAAAHLATLHRHYGAGGFVQAVALGVFLYGGFEWVTTSAEEVRRPELVPRGMALSVVVLFGCCALATEGMIRLLSKSELTSAYPQLFLGRHAAGAFGYGLMCAITALTAINTFNGGFITASRFIYATAREGSLPEGLARLNRYFVPWIPVLALAVVSVVVGIGVAITDSWQVLVAVGAGLEAMIYVVAGLCVYRLRDRQPEAARPFRLRAGKALAMAGMVIFAVLALGASLSVNNKFNPLPLIIIVAVAGTATVYVLRYLPRLQAANAARARAKAEAACAGATNRRRRPASPSPASPTPASPTPASSSPASPAPSPRPKPAPDDPEDPGGTMKGTNTGG